MATILKCYQCKEPMLESAKTRPQDISPKSKWVICRKCNRGAEVIGDGESSPAPTEAPTITGEVDAMRWEETVTMKRYVTVLKDKSGHVVKQIYSDPERKKLIGEESVC